MSGTLAPDDQYRFSPDPPGKVTRLPELYEDDCPNRSVHDLHRARLERLLEAGAWSHPSFVRQTGPGGVLASISTPMGCGCMFVALAVQ